LPDIRLFVGNFVIARSERVHVVFLIEFGRIRLIERNVQSSVRVRYARDTGNVVFRSGGRRVHRRSSSRHFRIVGQFRKILFIDIGLDFGNVKIDPADNGIDLFFRDSAIRTEFRFFDVLGFEIVELLEDYGIFVIAVSQFRNVIGYEIVCLIEVCIIVSSGKSLASGRYGDDDQNQKRRDSFLRDGKKIHIRMIINTQGIVFLPKKISIRDVKKL
jgi:hypothetical protein